MNEKWREREEGEVGENEQNHLREREKEVRGEERDNKRRNVLPI